ncbi:MAG TPA: DUF1476 domain-containing protein [Methylocella sp.]|nr:DUF1476 domain-containing protein [Methylocella sp.]
MTTFDERENAFEAKLAHDEELRFLARARRDKQLGLWAAAKLGKTASEAEAYASALIAADVKSGARGVLKTIRADFDAAGVGITDAEIFKKSEELFAAAVAEVTKGTGAPTKSIK